MASFIVTHTPHLSPSGYRIRRHAPKLSDAHDRSKVFNPQDATSKNPQAPNWTSWETDATKLDRIPALPFPPQEVFLPGETKRLHVFLAKHLSLFDQSSQDFDNHFSHVLIDGHRRTMAAFGTLVVFRYFRLFDVGIHVSVDGVGLLRTD